MARRLPRVMVPVLSSSNVAMSPAASTDRPDRAITFARTNRSIPAMPMALSRAPIVVGIRQTSSATSTTGDSGWPAYAAIGVKVATASRKMIVSDDNRIDRATSFGVLRRDDPSTRAIILSRNDSPGAAVICTVISSDSTVVPPVTADRSPPASRMTGADSPVIADSSTLATPTTTSPSPGMISPALTSTRSPGIRWLLGTTAIRPSSVSSRAWVSVRALRSVSACALPRPSATASARLPNSTVSHSHTATATLNTLGCTTALIVVTTEPIHTTNITGLRHRCRGSSLRTAPGTADRICGQLSADDGEVRRCG